MSKVELIVRRVEPMVSGGGVTQFERVTLDLIDPMDFGKFKEGDRLSFEIADPLPPEPDPPQQ